MGPDVDIFLVAGALGELLDDRDDLVVAVVHHHAHDLGAQAQSLDMLAQAEEVELALVAVPVAADTLEYGGAVVEGMGHHADPGFGQRHELAPQERHRCRHVRLPFSGMGVAGIRDRW